MRFLFPLGFLALIGIPVLIAIYIIKNKYTEQIVSSTYIWNLSNQFLKRRVPISKIAGIISLILQILAVIFISFAIAHPVFAVPSAANDYCFVLDGSGSMNISYEGKTRFERGKEEIASRINGTLSGSTFTLIYADGKTCETVFTEIENSSRALELLNALQPGYGEVDGEDAVVAAQEYFNINPGVKTILFTDKYFESSVNAEVINVAANEKNVALLNVDYTYGNKKLTVTGSVRSYGASANVHLKVYLNGSEEVADEQTVIAPQTAVVNFSFKDIPAEEFISAKIAVADGDALMLDNEVMLYGLNSANNYDALIVSDKPTFFIEGMLKAKRDIKYETISTKEYNANLNGYDLYIFDSYSPNEMPSDGAVWFFNPDGNIAKSGFGVQGQSNPGMSGWVQWTKDTSSQVKTLLKDVQKNEFVVAKYTKCGGLSRNFKILLTHDNNPLLFTGTNDYGNREVVCAFNIQDADAALKTDFLIIIRNLINNTFPGVMNQTLYTCGDVMEVNVLANCESITVKSPLGNLKSLATDEAEAVCTLDEVGIYTVTFKNKGGEAKNYYVYSALPESESATTVSADAPFNILGEPQVVMRDGIYDDILYIFLILAVLAMADWMVYCYEQYQLR